MIFRLYNRYLNNKKATAFIICALVSEAVISLYSLNLALLFLSIALTHRIVSPMLSKNIFNSRLLRVIVSLFSYIIILQAVVVAAWLFNRNFPLENSIFVALVVILVMYAARIKRTEEINSTIRIPHIHDIASILIALAIFIPIVLHTLTSGTTNTKNSFSLLATGVDDHNHLDMFNARVTYDRGIFYETRAEGHIYSGDTYPVGWSAANVVIVKAFYPSLSVGDDSRISYIVSKLFWFLILLYVFCRVTLSAYTKLRTAKTSMLAALWLGIGLYIFGRVFISEVYFAGAYSFIPQMLAGLLILALLLQLTDRSTKNFEQPSLFLLALLSIGGCLSWILVLPAFILSVVAIVLFAVKKQASWKPIKHLLFQPTYFLPLTLVLLASLVQIYVMHTSHSPGSMQSFTESITLRGGVATYPYYFYALLVPGFFIYLRQLFKIRENLFWYSILTIAPLILFDIFIVIIQIIYVGEARYYFFKVLNLINTLLLPFCIAGFTVLLNWLESRKTSALKLCVFIVLFLFTAQLLVHNLLNSF